ncbi:hypothetical protein DCC24_03790 [Auritidibacter sp. NML100628]|nr:hypothetical protein DCC24_03790 [Auritidibacter sp. NML100628]
MRRPGEATVSSEAQKPDLPALRVSLSTPDPGPGGPTAWGETLGILLDELPGPHLPQLPYWQPLSELAVGLPGFLVANRRSYGWQVQATEATPGKEQRRYATALREQFQLVADYQQERPLPELMLEVPGPVTLFSVLMGPGGQKIIRDHGARRDVAHVLAEALAELVQISARILPETTLRLVVRDTDVVAGLRGAIATASGYLTERSLDIAELETYWALLADQLCPTGSELVFQVDLDPHHLGKDDRLLTSLHTLATNDQDSPPLGVSISFPALETDPVGRWASWRWEWIERFRHSQIPLHLECDLERLDGIDPPRAGVELVETTERVGLDPRDLASSVLVARATRPMTGVGLGRCIEALRGVADEFSQRVPGPS